MKVEVDSGWAPREVRVRATREVRVRAPGRFGFGRHGRFGFGRHRRFRFGHLGRFGSGASGGSGSGDTGFGRHGRFGRHGGRVSSVKRWLTVTFPRCSMVSSLSTDSSFVSLEGSCQTTLGLVLRFHSVHPRSRP